MNILEFRDLAQFKIQQTFPPRLMSNQVHDAILTLMLMSFEQGQLSVMNMESENNSFLKKGDVSHEKVQDESGVTG